MRGLLRRCGARDTAHVHARPIEPFQQCGELRGRQPHHAILDRRPMEPGAFEPLRHEAHASAVLEQQLHAVGALGPEHIDDAGEWIALQVLLHVGSQPIHAAPEVDGLRGDEHADTGGWNDRVSTLSAFRTSASVRASAAPRMRTVADPTLISIELSLAASGTGAVEDGGVVHIVVAASITSGAKAGSC